MAMQLPLLCAGMATVMAVRQTDMGMGDLKVDVEGAAQPGAGAIASEAVRNNMSMGMGDLKVDVEGAAQSGAGATTLAVLSFNLEGRGGNQVDQAGQDRRKNLGDYLEKMCTSPAAPHVILTQEDVRENINSCYDVVASCASEDYWWNDEFRFGDGVKMLNKVYVRQGSATVVPGSIQEVPLTTQEMVQGGLNPRCAAVATLRLADGGHTVTVASFHLSGGYVDDEIASRQASVNDVRPWITHVRQMELDSLVSGIRADANASQTLIIGGDTNGFPEPQLGPCQDGRLNFLATQWLKKAPALNVPAAKEQFKAYLTAPEAAEVPASRLDRVQAHVLDGTGGAVLETAGQRICSEPRMSTSLWGGQPDQFYTNLPSGTAFVVGGVGLNENVLPPTRRLLSDHNPVMFKTLVG